MRYKDLLNTNDVLHLLTNKLKFTPKQMGRSIFFLCPFHADKNPSLSFEPNRKIFTCFSCGFKANDIFDFWAQYRKISLEEALTEIGSFGYFSLSVLQEKKQQEQKNKGKTFSLFSFITDIYQHNLFTRPGKEVFDYLKNERQIDNELINRFSLGCSINGRQITNLLFQPENNNFSSSELLSTNLVWITTDNRTCDFFLAQQLIIPLANPEGKIIAFASRKIGEIPAGEGKYKYLPNYRNYHKSALLYNYHVAKKTRAEECYLVEGFFDVISLTKWGTENCVALLGTNLSEEQTKLLSELKKKLVLFLDGDEAGQAATINISVKLLSHEIDCEIVKPDYQSDPDEICRKFDEATVQSILQQRESPYSFVLDYYFTKWEVKENPQRVGRFIGEIAKIFQKFKINIRSFLVEKISELVKWSKSEVEPYFIRRNFPARDIRYWQIAHCQEIVGSKEKKIVTLCSQEWFFWLLVSKKNYFFLHQKERENYAKLYNYYISFPLHQNFRENEAVFPNALFADEPITFPESKVIETIFQEIDIVKQFILKNYGELGVVLE